MRIEPLKLLPAGIDRAQSLMKAPETEGKNFSEFLSDALANVNKLQEDSKQASINLATGKIQDVSEVVVATEKATIALQLTMQVRNKVLDAYQEIMRMQV